MSERIWDKFLTEKDKRVFQLAGYGKRGGFGSRPALFIIDVQYNFTGDEPGEAHEEGLKKYRTHCGEAGWKAVPYIERLLKLAREKNLPVFYTVSERRPDMIDSGVQVGKSHRGSEKTSTEGSHATQTVAPLAPKPQDILIGKRKPSAFFGTIFMSHLNYLNIDTLIMTGCTSSGCLRATTVDAYSFNFKVVIPEETAFDRFESSHAISLFDLNCKYADVIPTKEVEAYIEGLPVRT
ncbi:isochorismatase family protein [Sedimentitalea nanhaiensis]|uniref:Nicotinamidase-related amidase n=1 Tax=Sedimentitalea nanhaiensis TaxID=999627 RepID=A0A1I7BVA1_9RHOB|nr:isochorismatase family protein [Sedimentitalea nanhaiensis]SFT91092.1 Nicotinamidase-related amidase [Sedimentitalea nanhaiensis]